jgi:hypothetical protein
MNAPVHLDVDHLFHNGLDNRKKSLELKTRSQNLLNRRGAQKNSKTGALGVYWIKKKAKPGKGGGQQGYQAQLRVAGKRYRSPIKHTTREASGWYWAKRRELGIPDPEQTGAFLDQEVA